MKINSAFRCQFSPQNGKKNIFLFVEKERYKETNKCQYMRECTKGNKLSAFS